MRVSPVVLLLALCASAQTGTVERSVDPAREVVVLANETVPESVDIALHYCRRRGVPEANICRVKTTSQESVAWADFREQILKPLSRFIEKFPDALYVVPTWGIPSRITEEDPSNDNPETEEKNTITQFVTGRDYACVDAELALIPRPAHELEGWIVSDLYGTDAPVTRERNFLLVSRLDAPTAAAARALVDKAIYAETYGLEGKNYLDTRGLDPATAYGRTDEEMRQTVKVFEKYGLALEHEDTETEQDLSALADCLFYWGWYAGDYTGTQPFTFRTGAVAAHLHSCSACSVRHDSKYWVGPLLAHGVTCTTGTVYEPLTAGFPRMHIVYDRLFQGYTWGQATAMGNQMLSWMAVFVGDPLYAPFAKGLKEVQERNRKLATEGYGSAAALVDAGDLDGAAKTLADVQAIGVPFEGAQDTTFLVREIAARRLAKATGTLADLSAALAEARGREKLGNVKGAIQSFMKAAALSPMCFDANLGAGTLLLEDGRPADALPLLEKAHRIVPDSLDLAAPLGSALASAGRFKDALPILDAAAKAGAPPVVLLVLGECHLKARDAASAIKVLTDATAKDPRNRAAFLLLARAHDAAKDPAMQLSVLLRASKIYPETFDDIAPYKAVWRSVAEVADRAKDTKERDTARSIIKDFDAALFMPPSKGQWLELNRAFDDAAEGTGTLSLGPVPQRDLKVAGLPKILVGNASTQELTVLLKGPCSRAVKLKSFSGAGKPVGMPLGIYPGEYDVLVIGTKASKEKTIYVGRKTFEMNKEYGMVADNSLNLKFAD